MTAADVAVIDRFDVGWQVDAATVDPARIEMRRFDGLVDALLDGPLDDALRDIGLPASADICIRRLEVPRQRLWLDGPDRDFVEGWGRAIGQAVAAAVAGASGDRPGDDVVVYRSRAHALSDLVGRAALGDFDRVWAWRQLGLWPRGVDADAGRAVEVTVAALVRDPALIPGVLAASVSAGGLVPLAAWLGDHLPALARAAWVALGGRPDDLTEAGVSSPPVLVRARAVASTLFARAAIPVAAAAPWLRDSLATIAVAIAEPAAVARADAPALVQAVASILGGDDGAETSVGTEAEDPVRPPSAPDLTDELGLPTTGPSATDPPVEPPSPAVVDELGPPNPDPVFAVAGATGSGWGGLPFLLHVVADLGWPRLDDELIGDLGLRTVLHQVGLDLLGRAAPDVAPPRPDDPAVLAFCGLLPGVEPPPDPVTMSPDAADADDVHRRLTALGDSLLLGLRHRLEGTRLGSAPEPSLLLSVCRRRARVVADPGWIDVLLDLDEVSVDVRVAGLDLDPGYLPWLGCVVRFLYA